MVSETYKAVSANHEGPACVVRIKDGVRIDGPYVVANELNELASQITRLRAVEAELRGEIKKKDAALRIVVECVDDKDSTWRQPNWNPDAHLELTLAHRDVVQIYSALSPEVPRLIRLPSERDAALATLRRARDEAAVALAVGIDPNDLIAPGNLLAAFHAARVDLDAAEKEQPK